MPHFLQVHMYVSRCSAVTKMTPMRMVCFPAHTSACVNELSLQDYHANEDAL